jgi:hypothetical protein
MAAGRSLRAPGRLVQVALALALVLALVALLAVGWTWRPRGSSGAAPAPDPRAASALTLAVIGDVPSSPFQVENFPKLVSQIGSRPDNAFVAHLGDFKSDGTPCSDAYYSRIKGLFESFPDPVVYTPGHHDWTDCHKRQNGGTSPLNRLGGLKNYFFASPNTAIAQRSERFQDYAADGYPENVRFAIAETSFAAVHVVGSENGLRPWTGQRTANRAQREEVTARTRSAVRVLQDTFASATAHGDRSVVVFTQADMFPPDRQQRSADLAAAYAPVVSALAAQAAAFPGEVYLFNSGTGVYRSDRPLAADSSWRRYYGVETSSDRLHRVTVDGGAQATNYLRVTIDYRRAEPISWARVPVGG